MLVANFAGASAAECKGEVCQISKDDLFNPLSKVKWPQLRTRNKSTEGLTAFDADRGQFYVIGGKGFEDCTDTVFRLREQPKSE